MHVERLTKLAELMDAVQADEDKRKRFDINCWEHFCGSPACAAGWAMADPWFQGQGLKPGLFKGCVIQCPTFGELTDTEALEEFFDITESQSMIFHQNGYEDEDEDEGYYGEVVVTPAMVAERIRELLASNPNKKDKN